MDLHTPASSGYIHKTPAGNLSSGENNNKCIQCFFFCRENKNTHILFLSPLASMSPYCLFTQAKPKCCDYIGCRQSMGGANTTFILCGRVALPPCRQICWTITPVSSFWFKAWEWSADCSNLRAKITADQTLSDTINTGHFILLSCTPQWVFSTSAGNTCTHMSTYKRGHIHKWKHMEVCFTVFGFQP